MKRCDHRTSVVLDERASAIYLSLFTHLIRPQRLYKGVVEVLNDTSSV